MNYANILPDEKLFSKTAPPYISAIVNSGSYEVCVLAAVDDGELKGYGVFSHMKGSSRDIWLEYLYTEPRFREQGIASGLLEYAEGYMKKKKAAGLFCKLYVKYSEAKETASYLMKRGYLPLSRDGRLLAYRHGDMVDAGLFDLILRNRKKLPLTVKASEVSDKSIDMLLSEKAATGFSFDRNSLRDSFSRFILEGDRIVWALIAQRIGEDTLYLKEPFVAQGFGELNVYPVLLTDVINDARESFPGDFLLLLRLEDDRTYYGMMQNFNPPEREYMVQEYMKCLL
ncbi:MAG: GNAT family N-acetyltransferase [Lachnospiraceae bacterium]|nr:GNAT family N-acetyltransferase [Lachnospiraceae bacterium]